ncbi:MAG: hypothetical protein ACKVW3_04280 [Phycisphaerales bacterium]
MSRHRLPGVSATVALVAASYGVAQPIQTRETFLERLRTIYVGPQSGSVKVVTYTVPAGTAIDAALISNASSLRSSGPEQHVRIVWDGLDHVLLDRAHPNSRSMLGLISGEIIHPEYLVRFSADLGTREPIPSVGERFQKVWRFFPPALPSVVAMLTEVEGRVEHDEQGAVIVSGRPASGARLSRIKFDEKDLALISVAFGDASGPRTMERALEYQKVPGVGYRWPKVTSIRTEGYPDYPPHESLNLIGAPDISTPVPPETFLWWTYATRIEEEATGKLYGPNDVVIATNFHSQPVPPSAAGQEMVNLRSKAKADPTLKIIPTGRSATGKFLGIGGVACLVLATGLILRRAFGR